MVAGGPFLLGRSVLIVPFGKISKSPPNSASVSDAMMFLMIPHYICTGPFYGSISVIGVLLLDFWPRKKYPPALLSAYVSDR